MVLTWNGKNADGKRASAGTYTWRLTGSDADGSLLHWDGTSKALSGTFSVT